MRAGSVGPATVPLGLAVRDFGWLQRGVESHRNTAVATVGRAERGEGSERLAPDPARRGADPVTTVIPPRTHRSPQAPVFKSRLALLDNQTGRPRLKPDCSSFGESEGKHGGLGFERPDQEVPAGGSRLWMIGEGGSPAGQGSALAGQV